MKIAIYGKGGIGKSTISANVSAALANKGNRVFQIGCDPKHDSTRLLLGGKIPTTVLQYIRDVLPPDRKPEDIVYRGYGNIACTEAGGPEPGVGCAGRGIITTFELLEELGIRSSLFDITLYDVLGDVVCGGFAVPIRTEYANAIYIVTSGEYLSLYAANNILRGIKNYTENDNRIAGIIFNARGGQEEDARVKRFAEAVHLPVIARIPRSDIFARAEEEGCTLIERYPETKEAGIFCSLAEHVDIIRQEHADLLYQALPLDDEELEYCVLLRKDSRPANKFFLSDIRKGAGKSISTLVKNKRPLIGCAFAGATLVTAKITDAATVMHCPRSCVLSVYDKLIGSELRTESFSMEEMKQRVICTEMNDEDFIFGGEKKLSDAIESLVHNGYRTIFIVTACPPGIIGDDIGKVSSEICQKYPNIRILPVKVDGNLVGDFVQGMMDAYRVVTTLIPDVQPQNETSAVNIIGEMWLGSGLKNTNEEIQILLNQLEIDINCRFPARTDTESLKQFNNARLNLPARRDDAMESLKKVLASVSDIPFLERSLPTGVIETAEWLTEIAHIIGKEKTALKIIAEQKAVYQKRILLIKPYLEGKTLIISTYPQNLDWIAELAQDLGMNILKIGLNYTGFSEKFVTRYPDKFPIVHNYSVEMRSEDIQRLQPDLFFCTHSDLPPQNNTRILHIPYFPGYGFHAAVKHAEEWSKCMQNTLTEGWKLDKELTE